MSLVKKIFYTDIDGVLLNLEEIMRISLKIEIGEHPKSPYLSLGPGRTWCYFMEEAYGISSSTIKKLFDRVWVTPASHYYDAVAFVKSLQARGYRVIGLSTRPTKVAIDAALRDTLGLGLDDLVLVERSADKHGYFVKPDVCYVDDHPNFAANAGELGARSFLLTRDWNLRSLDLGPYERVDSLSELLTKL